MEKHEAEQIATAINLIRGDWPRKQIITILGRNHQHRPARDAAMALVWIAFDPETQSPARIDLDGPWWACSRLAGIAEPTYTPPSVNEACCPIHGDRQPCRGCRADELAGVTSQPTQQPADQNTVRAIRAQIREEQA